MLHLDSMLHLHATVKKSSNAGFAKRIASILLTVFLAFFFGQANSLAQVPPVSYPKVTGYVGIIHPLVTFSKEGTTTNFNDHYVVGMPTGINIWKSARVGFTFEAVPFVRVENRTSRMSNFLFHPGILVALGDGFTFAGRAAFETSGRYGFTPLVSKAVIRNKNSSYYVAMTLPVRFGNDHPITATIALQVGLAF